MRKVLRLGALAAALVATSAVSAAEMKITPANSKIEFLGTKNDGSHTGGFQKFTGSVSVPGADLAGATITVEFDTTSLYSDNAKLTNHLKSPDFFDVRTYPKAAFTSTGIKKANGGAATHQITGNLTLHGVTKPVTIPVKAAVTAEGVTLEGTFKIQREEFGMTYGKGRVHNDVTITVNVKATK
jgi:polyisoprenoid-binding protein YceI